VVSRVTLEPPSIRQDGFGTRRIEEIPQTGRVETLVVSPALATPSSEQAIRARAAHLTRLGPGPVGRVIRIERKSSTNRCTLSQKSPSKALSPRGKNHPEPGE